METREIKKEEIFIPLDDITAFYILMTMLFVTPFATYTFYAIFNKLAEIMQVRKGYIKARFILPNRREKVKFVKPASNEVKIKVLGKEKTFNFQTEKLTFNGNTPIETWHVNEMAPLDLANPSAKQSVSSDDVSNLVIRAYNLGIITATQQTKIQLIIMFIVLGLAAGAIVMGVMNWTALSDVATKMTTLPTDISKAIITGLTNTTAIPTGTAGAPSIVPK